MSSAPPPSSPKPRVIAARSSMRGTLISFAAVLGVALPFFIYMKTRNEEKKRVQWADRKTGGAMSQMGAGQKVDFKNQA